MSSVEEFIEVRNRVESLARQINLCIEKNAVQDSKEHLEEAGTHLETLKTMVSNDVQVIVADRLTRQLTALGLKIAKMALKAPARRSAAKSKAAEKKVKMPAKTERKEEPEINIFERP